MEACPTVLGAKVGGAIHFYYCSGTLSDSTFKDNSASQSGGAIYTEEISGAIYSTVNNHINITGCNFENNEAGLEGGAVDFYFSANCSIDNCNFENNTSNGCGGAIYCDGLLNNSVSNCNFTKNIANDDGGAIYWISNEGSVSNCNFDSNNAEDYGGAIYWHFNDGLITDSTFQNNIANDGGAVSGRSNVMNSNFTDNKANRNGGAINKGKAFIKKAYGKKDFKNVILPGTSGRLCHSVHA